MFYTNIYHILFGQIYQKYKKPIDKLRIVRYNKYRNWKTTVVVELPAFAVVEIEAESAEEAESLAWDKLDEIPNSDFHISESDDPAVIEGSAEEMN